MNRLEFVLLFGLIAPGLAARGDGLKPQPEATRTERVDFAAGGLIRLDGAYGDLFVEGWDRPEVEITVTKSMRYKYDPDQSERAAQHLESIRIVTERRSATELTISTVLPTRHNPFAGGREFSPASLIPPRKNRGGVTLEYHLLAPRNSRLAIHQGVGDLVVRGVTGDIEAACRMGDIVLWLSGAKAYSIDARSRAGVISSDLPGATHSYYLFGQAFRNPSPAPAQRLRLRVGFGGITIKPVLPESEAPPSPVSGGQDQPGDTWR